MGNKGRINAHHSTVHLVISITGNKVVSPRKRGEKSTKLKDTLSSTLKSILALKRLGVGEDHVNKGIYIYLSLYIYMSISSLLRHPGCSCYIYVHCIVYSDTCLLAIIAGLHFTEFQFPFSY